MLDRGLEQVDRALRVALEELGLVARLHEPGGVNDGVDPALHRRVDALAILDAALGELDVLQRGEELAVRALANERATSCPAAESCSAT